MDVDTLHIEEDRLTAAPPCRHCGLPVGSHPAGQGPHFCCTGCELVHEALQQAGYSNTFYQLSKLTATDQPRRPAAARQHDVHLLELDTQAFLDSHTRPASGTSRHVTLFLDGVHCAACVWLVERLPAEVGGVNSARLDLSRGHLTIQFEPDQVQLSHVAQWLAQFGYQAYPVHQRQRNDKTRAERRLLIKTGVAWALAGNVMLFAFAMYAGLDLSGSGDASNIALATGARWASLVLALVSVVYGGSEFFQNAWSSLRLAIRHSNARGLHMDTPISLGILVGFGYGAWATVSGHGEVWFDSITTLIAALLTARWLQLRSYRLAGDATDRLLNFIPTMARLTQAQPAYTKSEKLVKVDTLRPDDVIAVPAGEVFPVDGVVIAGQSIIDKSVLTGESRPEELAAGMWVEAGTSNLQSPVKVRVVTTGESTRVGRLLSWVGQHASKRAPVVMLADRLSGYFVAVLLLLTIGTSIGWYMIDPGQVAARVVALLVISCPCALGMATPLAMVIAAGRAARLGIFIKSSEAVQVLESVDAVVIDKTGTLTEGRMAVVETAGSHAAIQLAAQLEQHSNHPIAQAILRKATRNGLCSIDEQNPIAIQITPGCGITGNIDGQHVRIGKPGWVSGDATPDKRLEEKLSDYARAGHTPVAISVDKKLAAVLALGDRIRIDAPALVECLVKNGKQVYLLSGDDPSVVRQFANTLNIAASHALGGITPEGKKSFIAALQKEGHVVAMVGDGVNDAAALQIADAGITVEGGTTPSQVAADVFLTREGLLPVVETFLGATRVMGVVRKNLAFSLVYNILGASAAIVGLVTPFIAALAMPASSLVVVLGSVLQRPFRSNSKP
ncbi:MAG: heavy metal translocating P-type ATPase metal-binding domain-containing protein [Bacteroidota bacterium]